MANRFKLACSVHKILNTGHPPYLTELIQCHKPSRSTRSSASHLLSVPRHKLSFGARAFRVAAPKIWNSVPLHITCSSFRRHLKTHYFIQPISPSSGPCNAPWFSSGTLALYKSLTYLLTTWAVSPPVGCHHLHRPSPFTQSQG